MMNSDDTIAAISSAVGPAARMVVRLSGPSAISIAEAMGVPHDVTGGSAVRAPLCFDGLRVPSWVYLFRAPGSYTGEDTVELHVPGNPVLTKMLLGELMRLGARAAEPGEFTARAYFNGRIDLTEAEGVAAAIASVNEQELAGARQLLSGELARRLTPAMDLLADTLALIEVGIDFSEEDVSFLSAPQLIDRIGRLDQLLADLLRESARFERLAHEPRVVLVGRPNAGKSTLLNALAGRERAVVSPIAGTTRDALSAEVVLRGGAIRMVDVAGIEDASAVVFESSDIDEQMRRRALQSLEAADVVVLVHEPCDSRPPLSLSRRPALVVRTKADLGAVAGSCLLTTDVAPPPPAVMGVAPPPPAVMDVAQPPPAVAQALVVSAVTGQGMQELREALGRICFGDSTPVGGALALNVRHVRAIEEARVVLGRTIERAGHVGAELLALDLREALDALGSVLGRMTPDDLLGRIFSSFCIGK